MLPENVRPASYRGVKFEAVEVSRSGGRRLNTHELPGRDDPYTDDTLGRSARRWKLAAFIVGTEDVDADATKRDLIAALENGGKATLIHPTDGMLTVYSGDFEVRESSDSMNVVEFSLSFVEAGEIVTPQADRTSVIKAVAARLRSAVRTAQRVRRSVLDYGDKTRAVLSGDIEDRAQALGSLVGRFTGTDVSEFSSILSGMVDTANTLIDDTDSESDAWIEAFDALDEPPDRRTVLGALYAIVTDAEAATEVSGLSGQNLALAEESRASAVSTHAFALCAAADAIADETFVAYDDAAAVLNDVLADIDLDEPLLTDTDALGALQDLRAELLASLRENALKLPHLRALEVLGVTTALELAWALYQDAERADEIVERNDIADPLAVSGSLLVLTE